ncbi:MAG TPA: CDP-alcohol phosphatidyltransferase family protein [Candidatus Limnocylindria bacterium]|nr:CDP-alcohol phosphatidyltransferase family protein [Candidatus Limnocylindria bacterium]
MKERLKRVAHAAVDPLVTLLARAGVGADVLTVLGLLFSAIAGLAFFEGLFQWGALLTAAAGVCDLLDGQVARRRAGPSRFGAFLDSTLDRFGEALILVGIAGFYLVNLLERVMDPARTLADLQRGLEPRTWAVMALTAMVALVGSFMVSYTRARAEGLGLECKVGWFERPERLVLLIVAGAFGVGPVMAIALLLLTVLSFLTAAHRIVHVWRITRDR